MLHLYKRLSDRSCGIKDIDTKQGIVSGYFAAFGNKDSDGDIIQPGAFAKTIAERGPKSNQPRIRHLQDHDSTKAVCQIQELSEDSFGLPYVSKAGRHQAGQDYLLMCEDKIITEHSIGYGTIQQHYDKTADANYLTELKLWEGSGLQGWGANPNTPVTGIKSDLIRSAEDVAEMIVLLEKALRRGKYSDDAFTNIILPSYEAFQTALKSLRTTEFINALKGLSAADKADKKFLLDMIPHHQMALDMAEKVKDSDRLGKFAKALIKNQSGEITQMTDWLKEWFDAKPAGMKSTQPECRTTDNSTEPEDERKNLSDLGVTKQFITDLFNS